MGFTVNPMVKNCDAFIPNSSRVTGITKENVASEFYVQSPFSRLQSRAWSFACLAHFARRKKKERLLAVYI